jgi:hypothetical protein
MRQFIEYKVYGKTMAEIGQNAEKEWRELTGDENAELPRDTEIHVTPHTADEYVGNVQIRARVEK